MLEEGQIETAWPFTLARRATLAYIALILAWDWASVVTTSRFSIAEIRRGNYSISTRVNAEADRTSGLTITGYGFSDMTTC